MNLDKWREAQCWLPAWLDDTDWKTWLWHSFFVIAVAVVAHWLTPLWAGRIVVLLYAWREVQNIKQLKREGQPLKWIDHVGDVLVPFILNELISRTL